MALAWGSPICFVIPSLSMQITLEGLWAFEVLNLVWWVEKPFADFSVIIQMWDVYTYTYPNGDHRSVSPFNFWRYIQINGDEDDE